MLKRMSIQILMENFHMGLSIYLKNKYLVIIYGKQLLTLKNK